MPEETGGKMRRLLYFNYSSRIPVLHSDTFMYLCLHFIVKLSRKTVRRTMAEDYLHDTKMMMTINYSTDNLIDLRIILFPISCVVRNVQHFHKCMDGSHD